MDKYHCDPHGNHIRRFRGKSLGFGILVILAGLLLMARNMGAIEPSVSRIIFSWEMLLIAIGVMNLFSRHSVGAGLILVSIGVFFLLVDYFHLPFTLWHVFWPLLIIIIGFSMIMGAIRFRRHRFFHQTTAGSEDLFEDLAVFGGSERRVTSQSFKGGSIVAVFGGTKVDFSQSVLAEGNNVIEVVAVFGGATFIAPADWNIRVEVLNVFGGFADKRQPANIDVSKTLTIKGVALFGGGEIKSF